MSKKYNKELPVVEETVVTEEIVETPVEEVVEVKKSKTFTAEVSGCSLLNFRSSMDKTDENIVAILSAGERVEVCKINGNREWYGCTLQDGTETFAMAKYLKRV